LANAFEPGGSQGGQERAMTFADVFLTSAITGAAVLIEIGIFIALGVIWISFSFAEQSRFTPLQGPTRHRELLTATIQFAEVAYICL
jgi:hypothetical protein